MPRPILVGGLFFENYPGGTGLMSGSSSPAKVLRLMSAPSRGNLSPERRAFSPRESTAPESRRSKWRNSPMSSTSEIVGPSSTGEPNSQIILLVAALLPWNDVSAARNGQPEGALVP